MLANQVAIVTGASSGVGCAAAKLFAAEGAKVVLPARRAPKTRAGKRGFYRVQMRHGVSRIERGQRHTLGIIFHDAT